MRALGEDVAREGDDVGAGGAAGLGGFVGGVDLDVDADSAAGGGGLLGLLLLLVRGKKGAPCFVEEAGLLARVDAADGEEVGDFGERLAVRGLQAADEVPVDVGREEGGFGGEFLGVVLAEVGVVREEGEDVVGGFEFGDGD